MQKERKNSFIELQSKARKTSSYVTGISFSNDRIDFFSNITKIDKTNVPALVDEPFVNLSLM